MNRRFDERQARATARREEIAAGEHTRKKKRLMAGSEIAIIGGSKLEE
jgi:hypothetical protein